MTGDEILIISKLTAVRFLPGSWAKRFVNDIASIAKPETELSEKQSEWIYRLLFTYRKQVPHTYSKYKHHKHCRKAPKQTLLPPVAPDWKPERTKEDFQAKKPERKGTSSPQLPLFA